MSGTKDSARSDADSILPLQPLTSTLGEQSSGKDSCRVCALLEGSTRGRRSPEEGTNPEAEERREASWKKKQLTGDLKSQSEYDQRGASPVSQTLKNSPATGKTWI